MRTKLSLLLAIFAVTLLSSCQPSGTDGLKYYYYNVEFKIYSGTLSTTDVSEIDNALEPRLNKIYQVNEKEAIQEWDAFLASVDNSKVVFGTEEEYYTVSLQLYESQDDELESVPVGAPLRTYTWKK